MLDQQLSCHQSKYCVHFCAERLVLPSHAHISLLPSSSQGDLTDTHHILHVYTAAPTPLHGGKEGSEGSEQKQGNFYEVRLKRQISGFNQELWTADNLIMSLDATVANC